MSFIPQIDTDAIRRAGGIIAHSSTSFAVQALRLLSEIRDNTANVRRYDRIISSQAPEGTSDLFRVVTGQSWELKYIAFHATTSGVRTVRANGQLVASIDATDQVIGLGFPLPPGTVVTVDNETGTGVCEISCVYTIVGDTAGGKPGPWHVEYTSVDNVGVMSSIHLDGHPVNGSRAE